MAAGIVIKEFVDGAICSVCSEYFKDPVMVECGHVFCWACLAQSWSKSGQPQTACCPHCKDIFEQTNCLPNSQPSDTLGRVKAFQEGRIVEDKRGVFEGYQEPQKFIFKEEKDPICGMHDQPKEQRCHYILPKQEPFQDYKEHFHLQLQSLEKRREELKGQKLAEEQGAQKSLAQLEEEREKMRSTLESMQKFLEEKKSFWLSKLGEMEEEVEKKEENIRRLSQEICYVSSMITEMEQVFRQPARGIVQPPESMQLLKELETKSLISSTSPEVKNSEDLAPISVSTMDPAVFFYLLQVQIQAISAVVEWLICQSDGFLQREQQRQRRQTLLILALKHCLRRRTMMATQSRRKRKSFTNTQRQRERNAASAVHYLTSCHVPRSMWVCPRTERWWENEVLLQWDDQKWEENFRMSRETLFELVEQLRPQLQRQTTQLREPISVEKRVAIAVWWLSSLESYREVAEHFGVGKSTVGGTVREVCLAIKHLLLQHTVKLGDYCEIMDGFKSLGFPQCVGVVGGCHIPVVSSTCQGEQYMKSKGFFSVLLQGTIDHRGRFINVEAGWSDRMQDAFVFTNSQLYKAMDEGFFVPGNPSVSLGGVDVPPLILADSTYPLHRWLMKPYAGHLNRQKTVFNRVFNNCRNVVGRAFGRLKGRWHRLTGSLQVAEENIVCVLYACVVLHNICELKGHDLQGAVDVSSDLQLPPFTAACHPNEDLHVAEGEKVRDAISMSLIQQV